MDIRLCANELEPELTLLRHTFHQTPELGLQEFETTNRTAIDLMGHPIPSTGAHWHNRRAFLSKAGKNYRYARRDRRTPDS